VAAAATVPAGEQRRAALAALRLAAHPLSGDRRDYDALLERVADARIVLLGEASHGSHEFYRERARITKRLITELNFSAVTIAASWADAYRVNRYAHGVGGDRDAEQSLRGFERFPSWMWRNVDMAEFVSWLHSHNLGAHSSARKVGFYGLDLYGLSSATGAVIAFMRAHDVAGAETARARYECLQSFAEDSAGYGREVLRDMGESGRDDVVAELARLRREVAERLYADGMDPADEHFFAQRDAASELEAGAYYRTIFGERAGSWNLRELHLADTLDRLLEDLDARAEGTRVIVWAHNSHVGDGRRTDMVDRGERNLGELLRERHGDEVVSVGFTTYIGSVTAASGWDGAPERKHVRAALPASHEALLHETHLPAFLLCPLGAGEAGDALREQRLERAIGVIYRPDRERASHYFNASLADQFDALVHIDATRAVEPLERSPS
jgi:erythromycin esterase-like protein